MANRRSRPADSVSMSVEGHLDSTTPTPPEVLHATIKTLEAGTILHRVHRGKYRADQFNPGTQGNARFSPIRDAQGAPIPTLYGGASTGAGLILDFSTR